MWEREVPRSIYGIVNDQENWSIWMKQKNMDIHQQLNLMTTKQNN